MAVSSAKVKCGVSQEIPFCPETNNTAHLGHESRAYPMKKHREVRLVPNWEEKLQHGESPRQS